MQFITCYFECRPGQDLVSLRNLVRHIQVFCCHCLLENCFWYIYPLIACKRLIFTEIKNLILLEIVIDIFNLIN